MKTSFPAIALFLFFSSTASANTLTIIPGSETANGVSDSGTIVYGSLPSRQGYRYVIGSSSTAQSLPINSIGGPYGGIQFTGTGGSRDGSLFAGYGGTFGPVVSPDNQPAIANAGRPFEILSGLDPTLVSVRDVAANGNAVGSGMPANALFGGAWVTDGLFGFESLPGFSPGTATSPSDSDIGSVANAISVSEGNEYIVGYSTYNTPGAATTAALWTNRLPQDLGLLGGNFSEAFDVSSDGSTVVGSSTTSNSSSLQTAFKWTSGAGMQSLGALPGDDNSVAYAVSATGEYIVGTSADSVNGGSQGFIYDALNGMRGVEDIVTSLGISLIPQGSSQPVVLGVAAGVSSDGDVIVGSGFNPNNQEFFGWILNLAGTANPLIGDFNSSGAVEQGDLDLVLSNWGSPAVPIPAGWTGTPPVGIVDQAELDQVLGNWGKSLPGGGGTILPEPASTALLITWLGSLLCRSNSTRTRTEDHV